MEDAAAMQREVLDRVIGFRGYVAIGFGVMVGVGWLVYAGQWLLTGGALGAVLAFLLGAAFLIPVGRCYAELTSALPLSGGEVAFTYKAFGPLAAFVTAWALSMNYIAVTPFETIAVGTMFEALFPSMVTADLYTVGPYGVSWSTILPGFAAGMWVSWLNWRGARLSVAFQSIAIAAMLLASAIFFAVAFVKGDLANLAPLFVGGGSWQAAAASLVSVLVVVPFFLTGFDCIAQAAEESGRGMAPRQLGIAIVATILMGALFYTMIILALGLSAPAERIAELAAKGREMPLAEVFRVDLGSPWLARLVLFAGLLGILSTLNGIFLAATRILFAQGRGGLLPHWFAVLHPVHHTPRNAVLFVGILALLGPFVGKAGLLHIVNSYSLVFSFVLTVTALAALRLRRCAPDMPRPYRTGLASIYLAIVVGLVLIALMTVPGSAGQMGSAEFLTVAVWMALGLLLFAVRQSGGRMLPRAVQRKMILGTAEGQ
jgi:amino acid transporter